MKVNKSDIMKFFEEREKELRERLKEESLFTNLDKARLNECLYIRNMISIIWDIIHQKKEK